MFFFPKFKFGALDIFQGVHGVREKSGKSILVREVREFGNFWEKSGKIGISASFLKNGQIFAVWPIC